MITKIMWSNRISSITDAASVKLGHLSAIAGNRDVMTSFNDRQDAGQQLGQRLGDTGSDIDAVIGLSDGGLPVAREVADHLNVPLYCLVVQPIKAPFNPELAIGAVTGTGTHWLDLERISSMELADQYIQDGIRVETDRAMERQELYGTVPENLEGKTVAIVHDGIETVTLVRAAMDQLADMAADVMIATPVMPQEIHERLSGETTIVSLKTPETFTATSQYYNEFPELTDEEESSYLDNTRTNT